MQSTSPIHLKDSWNLLLVGDRGVGKTAFAHQFMYNTFEVCGLEEEQNMNDPTLEDEFRRVIQADGLPTKITIFDSWVHQVCHEELPHIIRNGHAFILMYSTTQRTSFEDVVGYCSQVRRTKYDPDTLFILVGNKCDLLREREVTYDEGAALAEEFGCDFFETSAKTGENVQPVVVTLARLLKGRGKGRVKFWDTLRRWWNLFCC